ncbi:MAG: hypothetical protein DRJ01_18575, partial [Bacteroidetes bacterium]
MKKLCILLILSGFYLNLLGKHITIKENSGEKLFNCISSNLTKTELQFSLDGYDLEKISEGKIIYDRISYWNEGKFINVGKPDLPRFSRLVAIPNQGNISAKVLTTHEKVLSSINIYPKQPLRSESQPYRKEFTKDENFYQNGGIYPSQIVEIG